MKQDTLKNKEIFQDDPKQLESIDNVLDFPSKLKVLRKTVSPDLVKKREGWRDRNGNVQMVNYVEWHTVADILDQTTPNWVHEVKNIGQIGKIVTVTVAITIDGITREGIGTGFADTETGIKKAEHDGLKRAAVKFGIARELYRKSSIKKTNSVSLNQQTEFPTDPLAKSLSDLVTAKQLGMLRAISRELDINADEISNKKMSCSVDELSKKAASSLISYLQQNRPEYRANREIRSVG